MILPPGHRVPQGWVRWLDTEPFMRSLQMFEAGHWPDQISRDSVDQLGRSGVAGLVLDLEPGGPTDEALAARYRSLLSPLLGPPLDYGILQVWWLRPVSSPPAGPEQPQAWRERLALRMASNQREPDTLIKSSRWLKILAEEAAAGNRPAGGTP